MKQIRFYDIENNEVHGGIMLDNGNVICGCCGGLMEKDEEGTVWRTINVYDNWINLDEEICYETH